MIGTVLLMVFLVLFVGANGVLFAFMAMRDLDLGNTMQEADRLIMRAEALLKEVKENEQ